jgi:hypothetical protein
VNHWTEKAELLLRTIAADDLDGRGCYVVDFESIAHIEPRLHGSRSLAWTSFLLPTTIRPWLESQGRWIGDGFGTVVHRDRIPTWIDTLGCCVHELAHWVSDDRAIEVRDQIPVEMAEQFAMALRDWSDRGEDTPRTNPTWFQHEAPFVRAACHLAHRAGQVAEAIRPKHVQFATQYYPQPFNEETFMSSLSSELDSTGSIREILRSDAPDEFTELWTIATETF